MVFLWFDAIQITFAKYIFYKKFILLCQNEPKVYVYLVSFGGFTHNHVQSDDADIGPVLHRSNSFEGNENYCLELGIIKGGCCPTCR